MKQNKSCLSLVSGRLSTSLSSLSPVIFLLDRFLLQRNKSCSPHHLVLTCNLHLWMVERLSHRPGEREREREGMGGYRPLRGVKSQGRGSEVKRKSFLLAESHLSFSSNGAAICQSGREGRGQQVSLVPDAATAVPRGPCFLEIWLRGLNQVVGLFTVSLCPPTLNGGDKHGVFAIFFNRVSPSRRPAVKSETTLGDKFTECPQISCLSDHRPKAKRYLL